MQAVEKITWLIRVLIAKRKILCTNESLQMFSFIYKLNKKTCNQFI